MLQVNWNGLRQNWYLISCKWLRLTAGQSKKYWVFTKQGHARSYQRITKDMTKLEKIKSPKICLESCSCKITGATTISCVFFGLFFGCFRFNNDQTSKRGSTLRRLKASKACSSSAFPQSRWSGKEKRRKNWRSVGSFFCESPSCCCESSFFTKPRFFMFLCCEKKKTFQHSTFSFPHPPENKHF